MISLYLAMFVLPAAIIALAAILAHRARLRPTGPERSGSTENPDTHPGS